MKKAYIITESESDAEILKKLVPKSIARNTEFVAGSSRYSAQSLARSILAVRRLPVVLVVDAETENRDAVRYQEELLTESLRQVSPGIPFDVLVAVPRVENLSPGSTGHPLVSQLIAFLTSVIDDMKPLQADLRPTGD
jgi:hypothetical protein